MNKKNLPTYIYNNVRGVLLNMSNDEVMKKVTGIKPMEDDGCFGFYSLDDLPSNIEEDDCCLTNDESDFKYKGESIILYEGIPNPETRDRDCILYTWVTEEYYNMVIAEETLLYDESFVMGFVDTERAKIKEKIEEVVYNFLEEKEIDDYTYDKSNVREILTKIMNSEEVGEQQLSYDYTVIPQDGIKEMKEKIEELRNEWGKICASYDISFIAFSNKEEDIDFDEIVSESIWEMKINLY